MIKFVIFGQRKPEKRIKKEIVNMLLNKKVAVLLIIAAIALAACSPKEQGRWNRNTTIEIGSLPEDVCWVNNVPLILNATTESDGGFNLIYVRNNGDVVTKAWLTDPLLGVVLKPAGEFFWTGGKCPSE